MPTGSHATNTSQVKGLKELENTIETIAKNFDVGTTSLNAVDCVQLNVNVGSVFTEYSIQVNGKSRFYREALDETDLDPEDRVYFEIPIDIMDELYVEATSNFVYDVSMGSHLNVDGDVSMNMSVEVSDNLFVHQKAFIDNDVSMGSHLNVDGDASFNSSVEISDNLYVHQKTFIDNDVSMGSHLNVDGDVSFNMSLEISDNLFVHQKAFIDNDVSMGSHLNVDGDASFNSSVEISDNLYVHQKTFVDNDASFGLHLNVDGDVSFNMSLEISDNLIVHQKAFIDNDVSMGSKLNVDGDASFNSSVEISDNLYVHQKTFIDNDVSMGSHLNVDGDVSFNMSLEISDNLLVHQKAFIDNDVSMGTRLNVDGDVSLNMSVEISDNLFVHQKAFIDNDVSMGSKLNVNGDASFNTSVEISNNLFVHQKAFIDNDVSMGSHLNVDGDASFNSSVEISDNLYVHQKTFIDNDVSMGSHLNVDGDVSFNMSLEISDNLLVHQKAFIDNDVSMGSHLNVDGDVSFNMSLEISDNLFVHQKAFIDNDVSMGANLNVDGDASFNSSVEISDNLFVHQKTFIDNDVSMGSHLNVGGDASFNSIVEISDNLLVHNKFILDENATLKSDVSMNSNVDISSVHIINHALLTGDISINNDGNTLDIDTYNMMINSETPIYIIGSGMEFSGPTTTGSYHIIANSIKTDLLVTNSIQSDSSYNSMITNQFIIQDFSYNDVYESGLLRIDADTTASKDFTFSNSSHITAEGKIDIGKNEDGIDISYTTLNIYASSNGGEGIEYDGNVTIGQGDDNDINATNLRTMLLYGDLRIKHGGNLIIEDVSNNITELQTNVQVTDILNVSNYGTGPTLTVNQTATNLKDIAHFQDDSMNVFVIGPNGNVATTGLMRIGYDISENSQSLQDNEFENYTLDVSGHLNISHDISSTTIQTSRAFVRQKLGVNIANARSSLDISATDALIIPVGTNEYRPGEPGVDISSVIGMVRFNLSTHQFEGFGDSHVWQGLGGVIDINQDTLIRAEDGTSNNDQLKFFTAGKQRMIIDNSNNHGYIGIANDISGWQPQYTLDILGDLHVSKKSIFDSSMNVNANVNINNGFVAIGKNERAVVALDISSNTAVQLPVGSESDKSEFPSHVGMIRYNETTTQFEGYSSDAWQGLGGVIDINQDTLIRAEDGTSNNDQLKFFTAGKQRMIIDNSLNNGFIGIANDISGWQPQYTLDISGDLHVSKTSIFDSSMNVNSNLNINNGFVAIGKYERAVVALDISSNTAVQLPVGSESDKSEFPSHVGMIRYNETTTQFEGYSSDAWQGLGGVIDIDQDTYVEAEDGTSNNNQLKFFTAGTQRMIIDNSLNNGFIGINVNNPSYNLDISGSTHMSGPVNISNSMTVDDNVDINNGLFVQGNVDISSGVVIDGNVNIVSNLDVEGMMTVTSNSIFSQNMDIYGTLDVSNNFTSESISTFNGTTNFNADVNMENLTANQDINVIGTSLFESYVKIDSSVNITDDLVLGGELTANSDRRIKDNLQELSFCLDKVEFMKGYKYTRTDLVKKEELHIGVIAQEIEQFYPELVKQNKDTGIKSVNYSGLSAVLLQCVRELRHENENLKKDINDIRKKLGI
jgi:UDP-3-O-[3-hydroxymyristoyl] glucosamine N-acyltransferase